MKTIKELRERLVESQGTPSKQRLPILEDIWSELSAIEKTACRSFDVSLETLQQLRVLIPEVEAAKNRALSAIKRSKT